MKILSIIVPIYNVEAYLEDCLDSLLHQDIESSMYEIICINDGSTDKSKEILDKLSKIVNHIVIIHQSNQGVSAARNKGIELAKGEYIWFVDADDVIAYNCLGDICKQLNEESPDLLFVKPIAFNDGDDIDRFKTGNIQENETTEQYHDWLWTRILKRNIIVSSGVRFNSNVSIAEDHMFCTMLNPYINDVSKYPKVVYGYRKRANSLSTTSTKNKISELASASKEFLEYGQKGIIDYDLAYKEACFLMTSVMYSVASMPRQERKTVLAQLKEMKVFPLKRCKSIYYKTTADGMSGDNKIIYSQRISKTETVQNMVKN